MYFLLKSFMTWYYVTLENLLAFFFDSIIVSTYFITNEANCIGKGRIIYGARYTMLNWNVLKNEVDGFYPSNLLFDLL